MIDDLDMVKVLDTNAKRACVYCVDKFMTSTHAGTKTGIHFPDCLASVQKEQHANDTIA
jgi:hypothetical protein